MEEAFFDTPIYREFAQLDAFGRLPDESTILRFRHRLEKHKLAEQILAVVNELLVQKGLLLKPPIQSKQRNQASDRQRSRCRNHRSRSPK
jgi:IS5 family transposase